MDNHFGKEKFRSGNIPFTMFGPFDQKSNVLFRDTTDGLKTSYEFMKVTKFERNLESFMDIATNQYCSNFAAHNKLSAVSLVSAVFILTTTKFLSSII